MPDRDFYDRDHDDGEWDPVPMWAEVLIAALGLGLLAAAAVLVGWLVR